MMGIGTMQETNGNGTHYEAAARWTMESARDAMRREFADGFNDAVRGDIQTGQSNAYAMGHTEGTYFLSQASGVASNRALAIFPRSISIRMS
jgi:hypothetical protein